MLLGGLLQKASVFMGSGLRTMQMRCMTTARNGDRGWWQPVLPALAKTMCPGTYGKGGRRKKMQQRQQQIISMHARRKEGTRRNTIKRALKDQAELNKVREIYRQYGEILRAKALGKSSPNPS